MAEPSETHYQIVARAIAEGRVVPLLGAGVNMLGRPSGAAWERGRYLPSGPELAIYLAGLFDFPRSELKDLLRVSQYISVMTGSRPTVRGAAPAVRRRLRADQGAPAAGRRSWVPSQAGPGPLPAHRHHQL